LVSNNVCTYRDQRSSGFGEPASSRDSSSVDSSSSGNGYYEFVPEAGSLTLKYNGGSTTWDNLKFHGAASVEVMGKLIAPDSGDSDMKAYAYGEWYGGSARHTSANVTITKISTGHYKVEFNPSPGNTTNYIVIGNLYVNPGFIRFSKSTGLFFVDTYDTSGTLSDKSFTFVVYKK